MKWLTSTAPPMGIGLPVKNGEAFIEQALTTLSAQTYADFEVLVADNCSTDHTQEIVAECRSNDPRIHYVRHERDAGPEANHNFVVTESRAQLFAWASHDDLRDSTFLTCCINQLAADRRLVAAFTNVRSIDRDGDILGGAVLVPQSADPDPVKRFTGYLDYGANCVNAFAVTRRDVMLTQTPLMLPFVGSDRVYLAALALAGATSVSPDILFSQRLHPGQVSQQVKHARPGGSVDSGAAFLTWRHGLELSRIVRRAKLTVGERRDARRALVGWATQNRNKLARSALLGTAFKAQRLARVARRGDVDA